jgi:RNA recognition motif-containing protein
VAAYPVVDFFFSFSFKILAQGFSESEFRDHMQNHMSTTNTSAPLSSFESELESSTDNFDLEIDDESQRCTLFVGDLDRATTREDVFELFLRVGQVVCCSSFFFTAWLGKGCAIKTCKGDKTSSWIWICRYGRS